jgi:putative dehydrogenase
MMLESVAIIGAGSMGAGIGAAIHLNGVKVLSPLSGRSPGTLRRALAAGMVDAGPAALGTVEIILSIVPPDQALNVARDLRSALADAPRKPVYIDCNPITPETAREVEALVASTGARFVDGGIIGLPPGTGRLEPVIYLSGPHIEAVSGLAEAGLQLAYMRNMPVGAASALKLAYAGITKGLVSLGASMALVAQSAGVGDYFRAELARSQPQLSAGFSETVPDMLGKAMRWVPEMDAVSDLSGHNIHMQIGAFLAEVARDDSLQQRLRQFYKAAQ